MFAKKVINKAELESRSKVILSKMTLKEKVHLLNGNWNILENITKHKVAYNPVPIETNGCERLGVPTVRFSDGPRGISMGNSTCFPVSMARGASFDTELEARIGDAIGIEARSQNSNYFGGVCINLLRHPAWGRAQETYGEDPYHVGEFGLALTKSVQDHGVMACVKHYAVNNIEDGRFFISVEVDDRSLHEVYLPHFKKCVVDGGAASLMGAYNKFEGDHVCESKKLMTDILRDMWGFEGFVSSDFVFGIRNAKKAIEAGMDVEMPTPVYYHDKLVKLVKSGEVHESFIDVSALRVIMTTLAFEELEDKMIYSKDLVSNASSINLAREAAEESMVLMKNKGSVLPLNKRKMKKILIVGDLANKANLGDMGSSQVRPRYAISPLQGISSYLAGDCEIIYCSSKEKEMAKNHAKSADAVLVFSGYDHTDEGESLVPPDNQGVSYSLIGDGYKNRGMYLKAAVIYLDVKVKAKKVASSEVEGEGRGGDRLNLGLRSSDVALINEIGGINPNTVVNLVGGSMIKTCDWEDNAPCILQNWYSGMEGGNALARILFGDVNPSGKMPFVTVDDSNDLPFFTNKEDSIRYDYYHGYTLLDKKDVKARYAFGHGLSYTTFEMSNHSVETFDDRVRISVDVTNTGNVDGKEVVQVYIGYENSSVIRHKKELKGFKKIFVKSGSTETVAVDVMIKELEYFCEKSKSFVFENMGYQLYVGNSSDDINLTKIDINLS